MFSITFTKCAVSTVSVKTIKRHMLVGGWVGLLWTRSLNYYATLLLFSVHKYGFGIHVMP